MMKNNLQQSSSVAVKLPMAKLSLKVYHPHCKGLIKEQTALYSLMSYINVMQQGYN